MSKYGFKLCLIGLSMSILAGSPPTGSPPETTGRSQTGHERFHPVALLDVHDGPRLILGITEEYAVRLPMELKADILEVASKIERMKISIYAYRSQGLDHATKQEVFNTLDGDLLDIVEDFKDLGYKARDHLIHQDDGFIALEDLDALNFYIIQTFATQRKNLRDQANQTGNSEALQTWEEQNASAIETLKVIKPLLPEFDRHLVDLESVISAYLVLLSDNMLELVRDDYERVRFTFGEQVRCQCYKSVPPSTRVYDWMSPLLASQANALPPLLAAVFKNARTANLNHESITPQGNYWVETVELTQTLQQSWLSLVDALDLLNIPSLPRN